MDASIGQACESQVSHLYYILSVCVCTSLSVCLSVCTSYSSMYVMVYCTSYSAWHFKYCILGFFTPLNFHELFWICEIKFVKRCRNVIAILVAKLKFLVCENLNVDIQFLKNP